MKPERPQHKDFGYKTIDAAQQRSLAAVRWADDEEDLAL
jgi:hypothetical protein